MMDPNAAWAAMWDESADIEDRWYSAQDLMHWLVSGGFPPDNGLSRETVLRACRLCQEGLELIGEEQRKGSAS